MSEGDAGVQKCFCKNRHGPRISKKSLFQEITKTLLFFFELSVGYPGVFGFHRCTGFTVCPLSVSYYIVPFKKQK